MKRKNGFLINLLYFILVFAITLVLGSFINIYASSVIDDFDDIPEKNEIKSVQLRN